MLHPLFIQKLPDIKRLLHENNVERAYAFGSVCTPGFNEQSDIDLLVHFKENIDFMEKGKNYFTLLKSLKNLFRRNIDLVTESSLRNPYFIEELNETRVPIYG